MASVFVTSLGLISDIVGALITWYFVAEVNFADRNDYQKGKATLVLSDPTQKQIRSYNLRVRLSRLGVALIVVGFILQLIGNCMS